MDDMGERYQIASRDWRIFWGAGLRRGRSAGSPNAINPHCTGKIQAHRGNVKCLDLTPISQFQHIWERMSEAQHWGANQKFLDRAIARGGDFLLDKPIKSIDGVSGQLRKELNYLSQRGYQLSEDGSRMVRSPEFEAQIKKGTEQAQQRMSELEHGLEIKPH